MLLLVAGGVVAGAVGVCPLHAVIVEALGRERYNKVFSTIYLMRSDVVPSVRQTVSQPSHTCTYT